MENFCSYCSVIMASEAELVAHCNSEGHQLTIMSDEGREWKFRAPARGVGSDQYALCVPYSLTGKCRFGTLCCDAHGEEELNEWKDRFDYRQMKLQRAKECKLQGRHYTEQLLEKWLSAANPNIIMSDSIENINMVVEPDTNLTVSEKNCCREWIFRLSAKATLRHVALLYETHRNHFRISQLRSGHSTEIKEYNLGPHCQEWSNTDNSPFSDDSYTVKVRFLTAIYGTFRQDIVFDFGFEPVLVKKLCVDVVSVSDLEKLQQARETVISFTERWSNSDVEIVPFENRPYPLGEQELNLMKCYPVPDGMKVTLSHDVIEQPLTKNNYCGRQHELLTIEEVAQYELLSTYNVEAVLNLTDCYLLTPNSAVTAKYAHGGELFANMTMSSVLSEDSASGRLVLTNCSTVLLASIASKGEKNRKVYEAVIEDKGKTVIYIRLSKKCVEELNMKPDREFKAEVQFQLNRLPMCEMHFAVDRLHPPSLVFPDVSVRPQLWTDSQANLNLEVNLNPKQREAVLAITTPLSTRLPPVLIIGPFGTGKTYTLAQAVKIILDQPNSRILVCTHSNSAADIYIREYLHPCVAEGKTEATPLRIYYRHRWVATVHPTVQQYCLINYEGAERSFLMPTLEDVKRHKVIVTTLGTARYLVQLGLEKGFFTHILIDEAAQAMECEAIMPLSLANENTRIVLAGDHMQLSPEIYSAFARSKNLHTSLLERLYDLYPEDFACKVLLCENYRSHEAIIQYTSELFYDNHLQASGKQPRHDKYYPLTFFTARGEDIQDCNSTAFHNYAEVYEIVERVIELKKNWPEPWGVQDETSIGVVTPYYDQVVRIRAELRKKKLHGVSVERVLNVQGKQFRVIFLSAVRTRQTCGGRTKDMESDLDHGFLSNARLLNTAITRAQSLVAVVGDPVSLCSVGKCRKLWEKFILTCHKENSLFGITWDSLRTQLDSMELKKNFILNPLAPEFVPGRMYHGISSISTSNENVFPSMPPPPLQNMMFFSTLQGPPLIQPPMAMMPTPHPYLNNVVNCVPLLAPAQPNPFQNYPFNAPAIPPPPPPRQRPSNIARMPLQAFPRRILSNRGPNAITEVRDFEGGVPVGRPLKRNEGHLPFPIINKQPIGRLHEEPNQNEGAEDLKRLLMNRVENLSGFHVSTNDVDNGGIPHFHQQPQNMINFEEKLQNKMLGVTLKSEEVQHNNALKNGFANNEFNNASFFTDHMRNNKMQHMNGMWGPPTPKARFEPEVQNGPYEEHGMMRTPFNEMNGGMNDVDRARTMYEPQMHSTFILPPAATEKWHGTNDNMNAGIPENPLVNLHNPLFHSSPDKLSVLDKLLPAGADISMLFENDELIKNIAQHLLTTEGPNSVRSFLFTLNQVKREAAMQQAEEQKKFMNRRFCSPSRNMADVPAPMRNTPNFVPPRPLLGNSQSMFNSSEPFNVENPMSPFSMPRLFPADKFESGLFGNGDQNRHEMTKHHMGMNSSPNHWPSENNVGMSNNIRCAPPQEQQQPPVFEMSKLSMANMMEPNRVNGEVMHNGDMYPNMSSPFHNRRRFEQERPEDNNLRRMWSSPEMKVSPIEQGWPKNNPLIFHDSSNSQTSYLSRLRNISNSVDGVGSENSFSFDHLPRAEQQKSPTGNVNLGGSMTAGPLSMSYPDIPDIVLTSTEDSALKVIRKPMPRSSENVVTSSPFAYDINLQSNSESPLRFSQLSSEGMTYAKILRSPQH